MAFEVGKDLNLVYLKCLSPNLQAYLLSQRLNLLIQLVEVLGQIFVHVQLKNLLFSCQCQSS